MKLPIYPFAPASRLRYTGLLAFLLNVGLGLSIAQDHPQVPSGPTGPVPPMESHPGGAAILYLDFDGEQVQDAAWNNGNVINAAPSGLTTEQIRQVYEVVKEDYLPFNVNVTTRRDVYDSRNGLSKPMRLRMIITPTDHWYFLWKGESAAEGRAETASFRRSGTGQPYSGTVPGWVFITNFSGNAITTSPLELGGIASHEAGHAFGLMHDGWLRTNSFPIRYFFGNGLGCGATINGQDARWGLWTPIMGSPEAGFLSQWSPGGLPKDTPGDDGSQGPRSYWGQVFVDGTQRISESSADNPDDIAVLGATGTGTNNFGLRTTEPNGSPDHGATVGSATTVTWSGDSFSASGMIGRAADGAADEDWFRISLPAPGTLTILTMPAEPFTSSNAVTERTLNSGIANLYMAATISKSDGSSLINLSNGSATAYNPGNPSERGSVQTTEFLRRRRTFSAVPDSYYLKISSSSYGNPYLSPTIDGNGLPVASTGFTSDGNMGAYSVSGSVVWSVPQITSPLVAAGVLNQAILPYQAVSSITPVTWSASGLPTGLNINSTTGVISGTTAVPGTANVTLRASTAKAFGEATLVLTISSPSPPVIISASNVTAEEGQSFFYQIVATGGATAYGLSGGAVPGLSVHPTTGLVSGIPTTPGNNWSMTVTASNTFGTGQLGLNINVRPSLAGAVDNPALSISYSGNLPWFHQTAVAWTGGDAAQSGAIGHNQTSSFQTSVTGPAGLSFYWRTDCELEGDALRFELQGVQQARITGATSWERQVILVPAGVHTLKWIYSKNATVSTGMDTAWVDEVVIGSPVSAVSSSTSVTGVVGSFLTYSPTGTLSPTSFSVTGTLPTGLFYSGPGNIVAGTPTRAGSWPVTVGSTNAYGTGTAVVTFTILSSFQSWASSNALTGADALPTADTDRDGWNNLLEMAFSQNPRARNPAFQLISVEAVTKRLRATFTRKSQYLDVIYQVQTATTPAGPWTQIAESRDGLATTGSAGVGITETGSGTITVTVTDTVAPPAVPRRFMRMKITQQ